VLNSEIPLSWSDFMLKADVLRAVLLLAGPQLD